MKTNRDWREIAVTDIEGFYLGNARDEAAGTGCTAVLCPSGAFAGVDVRGSAPASREHALLSPVNMVQQIHGVMLSGGSAYGLECADGAMAYLEEQGIGFDTGFGIVPIVCASSLFDLPVAENVTITRADDGSYHAEGAWIDALVNRVNFNDRESMMYFERSLVKYGIIDKLREAGCAEGDEVWIDDISFEFVD